MSHCTACCAPSRVFHLVQHEKSFEVLCPDCLRARGGTACVTASWGTSAPLRGSATVTTLQYLEAKVVEYGDALARTPKTDLRATVDAQAHLITALEALAVALGAKGAAA